MPALFRVRWAMLKLWVAFLLTTGQVFATIEDNSFLLEEGYNQPLGVYQFIQKYQSVQGGKIYNYSLESEIPITDKVHQFSIDLPFNRSEIANHGSLGDIALSFRWQPLNKEGFLLAERFSLILPTGKVNERAGNGVYGFEFMQAATLTISEKWMNHWNMGFDIFPRAKAPDHTKRRTLAGFSAGTSLVYLASDDFNVLLEALVQTGQSVDQDGTKNDETTVIINPGFRFAWDFKWKATQVVPGISFPIQSSEGRTHHGILFYLSLESVSN